LPGAKEYHRSTAIVSAFIVPTAADLAYGTAFAHDREIAPDEPGLRWPNPYQMRNQMRDVVALGQFPRVPIRAFHKTMVSCLATNGGGFFASPGSPYRTYTSTQPQPPSSPQPPSKGCFNLTFSQVPPEF
jgi:hypothetical protein